MIKEVKIENFGPLEEIHWENLSSINVVLGKNGTGKTFLLKALYSMIRTLELHKRGNLDSTSADILLQKLYWTFQSPESIGSIVNKSSKTLKFSALVSNNDTEGIFSYEFGKSTRKEIRSLHNECEKRSANSIFFPAKELLSIHNIILKSREVNQEFGFDDTYYDLAKALSYHAPSGRPKETFAFVRDKIRDLFGGYLHYDKEKENWFFDKKGQLFPIHLTSEGVKKLGIVEILLMNKHLSKDSIIFFDEPESGLHPQAIDTLFSILYELQKLGIQVFIATHSYFVIKHLYLLAQEHKLSIPIIHNRDEKWHTDNLVEGMPENDLISESIALYEREVNLAI